MADTGGKAYAVLLAGGTGTRLWPVSRQLYPKQLVKFIGDDSLVQSTIKRLWPILEKDSVRIVCGEQHLHEIARHMQDIGLQADGKIICEPSGRNTAPAILLAVLNAVQTDRDAVLCVFPADHVVGEIVRFHECLTVAIRLAEEGHVVTFGITPHYPETGYGYVEEKTARGVVLPSDFGWSDIGSWKSLYDFLPKDNDLNVIDGDVVSNDTRGCFILGRDRLIATNHLENMVIVETPDSIFVSDIDRSRDVKSIVARLKASGRKEYHQHRTVHFPWGSRTLLEQKDGYTVCRLLVYPAATLETEVAPDGAMHLIAVKGPVRVDAGGQSQRLKPGNSLTVSAPGAVNIENRSEVPVFLIQVLSG
ncbi:MAG: sugar phosphate nucleotidyltransferase [Desulfobacterales bacterium]